MRAWLRHHYYALWVAFRRLRQMPFSSLSNIVVIALVLSLPLMASSVLLSVQPMLDHVHVNPVVTLFMKNNVSLNHTQEIAQKIKDQKLAEVVKVEVISQDQALRELKSQSNTWSEALKVLPNNPLPHSILLELKNNLATAQQVQSLVSQWSLLPGVDTVQFDSAWAQKLSSIVSFIQVVFVLLALGVSLVVVATVFNTVRMQALVQRDEIAVARLVGASEDFVRRPFLYFGALSGLIAMFIALIITSVGMVAVNALLTELVQGYGLTIELSLPRGSWLIIGTLFVMIIAATAARWSVTRTSKF